MPKVRRQTRTRRPPCPTLPFAQSDAYAPLLGIAHHDVVLHEDACGDPGDVDFGHAHALTMLQ